MSTPSGERDIFLLLPCHVALGSDHRYNVERAGDFLSVQVRIGLQCSAMLLKHHIMRLAVRQYADLLQVNLLVEAAIMLSCWSCLGLTFRIGRRMGMCAQAATCG